ncbi:hypothetical protein BC829DRAFT_221752 [Chytridium lagenaria]|nr:hypothetical protein BC829DRAFT_221752 [Chytridium lagenaria]
MKQKLSSAIDTTMATLDTLSESHAEAATKLENPTNLFGVGRESSSEAPSTLSLAEHVSLTLPATYHSSTNSFTLTDPPLSTSETILISATSTWTYADSRTADASIMTELPVITLFDRSTEESPPASSVDVTTVVAEETSVESRAVEEITSRVELDTSTISENTEKSLTLEASTDLATLSDTSMEGSFSEATVESSTVKTSTDSDTVIILITESIATSETASITESSSGPAAITETSYSSADIRANSLGPFSETNVESSTVKSTVKTSTDLHTPSIITDSDTATILTTERRRLQNIFRALRLLPRLHIPQEILQEITPRLTASSEKLLEPSDTKPSTLESTANSLVQTISPLKDLETSSATLIQSEL